MNMTPKERADLRYELLCAVAITGDLAKIEECIERGVDANLEDMSNEEAMFAFVEQDWERVSTDDEFGLFVHIMNEGTLISLAIEHSTSTPQTLQLIDLLLSHGADVTDPANMKAALACSSIEFIKWLLSHGAVITPALVIYAFHCSTVQLLQYLYQEIGIRLSRHDRAQVLSIVRQRDDFHETYEMYEKFSRRVK